RPQRQCQQGPGQARPGAQRRQRGPHLQDLSRHSARLPRRHRSALERGSGAGCLEGYAGLVRQIPEGLAAERDMKQLGDLEYYSVYEFVADYKDGFLTRREMMSRVMHIAGGVASAASILSLLGCGGAA